MHLVKAGVDDIVAMQDIVADEVKNGTILIRSDDEVATNLRSYVLAKEGDALIGYVALHLHSPSLSEIRSLIVVSTHRKKGVAHEMVKYLLREARELGLEEVLSLTYEPAFFSKLGFKEIPKESVPGHKIWADCIKCIHFPICNEISMIYKIGQDG